MLASQNKTTYALTTRKVWSGRNHPHFSPRSNMSQITGLDNRQMLPPYLPITRGEDRLFGHMVDFVFPASVTLDYPWAVPHLPIPDRQWRHNDLDFTPGQLFPMFFMKKYWIKSTFANRIHPQDRLAALAAWFRDLAGASEKSLIAMYREDTLEMGARKRQAP